MFTTIFGDTPNARILGFLKDHAEFDYTISEIARNSDVSRPTTYKVVDEFVKNGILIETRKVGISSFYKLNLGHNAVKYFMDMDEGVLAPSPGGKQRRRLPQDRSRGQSR
ncbi:MAG: winged helix-turn-helix transcriptional regulator [Euryarchaeota archaeon]|nr:winged helix-turn-helix transcriptional regulator [Euryarchaeota archaeon]